MKDTNANAIGLDWTVDMRDARRRLGRHTAVQGNVDPCILFATKEAIKQEVVNCITSAGLKVLLFLS